jgi:hypothetical protein
MTLPQLVRTVKKALHEHGTKVLILDDITRLKLHREADQDVLDLIRSLLSVSVTLILVGVGIRQSGLLRGGQLDPRTGQWSASARSATTPRPASKPGAGTWLGSRTSCGSCAPSQACSPPVTCPSTCSAAPAGRRTARAADRRRLLGSDRHRRGIPDRQPARRRGHQPRQLRKRTLAQRWRSSSVASAAAASCGQPAEVLRIQPQSDPAHGCLTAGICGRRWLLRHAHILPPSQSRSAEPVIGWT